MKIQNEIIKTWEVELPHHEWVDHDGIVEGRRVSRRRVRRNVTPRYRIILHDDFARFEWPEIYYMYGSDHFDLQYRHNHLLVDKGHDYYKRLSDLHDAELNDGSDLSAKAVEILTEAKGEGK